MARLTITLMPEEKAALASYALQQRRDPRAQAAIELRRLLEDAGFLTPTTVPARQDYGKPHPARRADAPLEVRS